MLFFDFREFSHGLYSRRGFLFASFQANRFATTSQREWQPVQIGFSQPRTSCPQSLRVDSSASLGMTQQANTHRESTPIARDVETRGTGFQPVYRAPCESIFTRAND